MKKLQAAKEFLAVSSGFPALNVFVINLLLAAVLGLLLSVLYIRYGTSLSNRRMFSKNFPLLTMTTMFIITVVKSSLALSLGLVGALSIVRFRAAIKEPEELSFLFLSIAIGLGLGADQVLITLVAFIIICVAIIFRFFTSRHDFRQDMLLTVSGSNPQALKMENVLEILKKHCKRYSIKRFDETGELFEAVFLVEFESLSKLNAVKSELRKIDNSVKIMFLDNKGVF